MNQLIICVNDALMELADYTIKNKFSIEEWPFKQVKRVLTLVRETLDEGKELDIRLLRAMKDIYLISFRNFEGTSLYEFISSIDDELRAFYNTYETLEPLGMDFGKGNPI